MDDVNALKARIAELESQVSAVSREATTLRAELARVDDALDHETGDRSALIRKHIHRAQVTQGAGSTHFNFTTR